MTWRTRKKKILFIADKSGFGGVQTIAYSLMDHAIAEDVEMSFIFLRNINARFNMKDIKKPDVYYARATHRYSLLPFFELARFIGKNGTDILHLNGNKSIIFGLLLKRLFFPDIRIIAHEHGGVFDYNRWYPSFLKFFRTSFDMFVTISNYRKNFLVGACLVDPAKIEVLDNFVDPARLRSTDSTAVENPRAGSLRDGKAFVIGYVGGLSRIKGCDVLLRALPFLKQRLDSLKVVIAGDGPARGELEELAEKLAVKEDVSFLGFVAELGRVYSAFDVMVIPSRSEEGPICLYEAWMMNLPVVASNAPVLNERVSDGETGILFQSDDPRDLAEKILRVSQDKNLAAHLRGEGFREAANHSLERYLVNLRRIYASL